MTKMLRRIRIAIENPGGWGLVWFGTEVIGRAHWHADGSGFSFCRGSYNVSDPELVRPGLQELTEDLEALERRK